jgi:hypothetical protein
VTLVDEVEELKCRVLELFPSPGPRPVFPRMALPAVPSVADPVPINGTSGSVNLPPPNFPVVGQVDSAGATPSKPSSASIPRPQALNTPRPESSPDGHQPQSSGPMPNQKQVASKESTHTLAAAAYWAGVKPMDPARADEAISVCALGAMMEGALDLRVAQAHLAAVISGVTDPVERMLLESFVLVHHRLIRLQVQAAQAFDTQRVQVYNAAVARLLAVQTQLGSDIRRYRASPAMERSSPAKIPAKTQDAVSGGGNEVASVDQPQGVKIPCAAQAELLGKVYEDPITERAGDPAKEPAAGSCRTDQRPPETTVAA